jgi:hypothetical protein
LVKESRRRADFPAVRGKAAAKEDAMVVSRFVLALAVAAGAGPWAAAARGEEADVKARVARRTGGVAGDRTPGRGRPAGRFSFQAVGDGAAAEPLVVKVNGQAQTATRVTPGGRGGAYSRARAVLAFPVSR